MSTLSEIIQRAFRESQILDIDRAPSTQQVTEALPILRGIILRHIRPAVTTIWIGALESIKEQKGAIFKNFNSYIPNRAVPQDCYVNMFPDQARSLLMPPSPGDGARLTFIDVGGTLASFPVTLLGNGNLVNMTASETLSTNNSITSFMFRRDIANWQPVSPVAIIETAAMPFPEEFDDMFVIELATRINPRYGKDMSEVTMQVYESIRSRFMGRYMQDGSSANPDILWESTINTGSYGDSGVGY
jgi:hypothetical protein